MDLYLTIKEIFTSQYVYLWTGVVSVIYFTLLLVI